MLIVASYPVQPIMSVVGPTKAPYDNPKYRGIAQLFKTLIYDGKNYENFKINELGDIKNIKTNRILKWSSDKKRYYFVTLPLGKRGLVKSIKIHKAMAETFLPNPNNLPYVDHIDEEKTNCQLSNLQWLSAKDNTNKHWKKILLNSNYCNNRKLTKEQVQYIKEHKDISNKKLANQFNVSTTTISNVKHNRLYRDNI
ncbi:MAG: HNH endonuclease [Alphaproteobacteria bacterium]|nr:HNH endonuclease [Alphaproteobacteria bacterium]